MTKAEFVKELSTRVNITVETSKYILDNISVIIAENLSENNSVDVPQIGRFYLTKRKQRYGFDVTDGNKRILDECVYPSCKMSTAFKNRVKNMIKIKALNSKS